MSKLLWLKMTLAALATPTHPVKISLALLRLQALCPFDDIFHPLVKHCVFGGCPVPAQGERIENPFKPRMNTDEHGWRQGKISVSISVHPWFKS
ncbi:MAG: hypothetical protein LBP68_01825 [Acidobacteriota bacterium]|jgi:hypothetical protein|nr:hypothetical protein [Acidobacteriota bacterium]